MDIRTSLAAQAYAATRPAPASNSAPGGPFQAASTAFSSFAGTLAEGEKTVKAAMVGQADPHALVQALAESQLAVETAVTVRDRVVEAYQEILRMQV
jgi:flagellar hook-basal body complex protein FliE